MCSGGKAKYSAPWGSWIEFGGVKLSFRALVRFKFASPTQAFPRATVSEGHSMKPEFPFARQDGVHVCVPRQNVNRGNFSGNNRPWSESVVHHCLHPSLSIFLPFAPGWNSPKSAEISKRHKEWNTQDFRAVYFNLFPVILPKFGSFFYYHNPISPIQTFIWHPVAWVSCGFYLDHGFSNISLPSPHLPPHPLHPLPLIVKFSFGFLLDLCLRVVWLLKPLLMHNNMCFWFYFYFIFYINIRLAPPTELGVFPDWPDKLVWIISSYFSEPDAVFTKHAW